MRTFGKCNGGGRRSDARQHVPLVAVFTSVTCSHAAKLVDVSCTGARLRGADLPMQGQQLWVSLEPVRAFGTVTWSRRGECGVAFDPPLTRGQLRALCHKVAITGSRPELKAAYEDWEHGLAR